MQIKIIIIIINLNVVLSHFIPNLNATLTSIYSSLFQRINWKIIICSYLKNRPIKTFCTVL